MRDGYSRQGFRYCTCKTDAEAQVVQEGKTMMFTLTTVAMLVLTGWLGAASAATWTGAEDQDWFNANNWDTTAVPGKDADVSVPAGSNILLTNETSALASFAMAGGTLTFSNWTTRLQATDVEINDQCQGHAGHG